MFAIESSCQVEQHGVSGETCTEVFKVLILLWTPCSLGYGQQTGVCQVVEIVYVGNMLCPECCLHTGIVLLLKTLFAP